MALAFFCFLMRLMALQGGGGVSNFPLLAPSVGKERRAKIEERGSAFFSWRECSVSVLGCGCVRRVCEYPLDTRFPLAHRKQMLPIRSHL
jgi:hypothetical protein